MRTLLSALCVALFAAGVSAQDIKPETIAEVKATSVFIRNSIETHKCTGSGFVVSADGASLLVATNAHVISSEEYAKLSPAALLAKLKQGKVTVLFGSGTPAERSATAEFVSIDPAADICILKVKAADVKDPPKALKVGGSKALVETSTVYSFGYPFGDALSTGKGPAVTVGKASISSLRTDESGKLAVIQIDGNLNPGNSGGPVIDTGGAVIGVATAIHRDGKGIGFVVPAVEVASMLAGKVSLLGANFAKQNDGRLKVTFEALVSNPAGAISGVTLNYKVIDPKADKLKEGADLSAVPGAKSVELRLVAGVARGEVLLDAAGGQLAFSARPSGTKKGWESSPTTLVSLGRAAAGGAAIGPDDKPPAGWKEIGMDDRFITVWVPEKSANTLERKNTHRGPSVTVTSTITQTLGDNGVLYRLERASLRLTGAGSVGAKLDTVGLRESLAKSLAEEMKGKIVEESDAKLGTWACKEYVIKGARDTAVVRIFVSIRTVYIAMVTGPAKAVSADDGSLFLDSFRVHPRDPLAIAPTMPMIPAPNPPGPTVPGPTFPPATPGPAGSKGGETNIAAGMFDPVYRDYGPAGGHLIGFELGLGKFFDSDVIIAGRPIYRSNGVESFGAPQGTSKEIRTIKAREGYAVGAMSLSTGLTVNGLSITYMRIAGDKLDPKDSYESEWVGIAGRRPDAKLGGTGSPIVGIVGKANAQTKYLTGLGLIYGSAESAGPRPPVGGGFPNPPIGNPTPGPIASPIGPSTPGQPETGNPAYPSNPPAAAAPAPAPAGGIGRWAIFVGGAIALIMALIVIAVIAVIVMSRGSAKKPQRKAGRRTRDDDDDDDDD